MSATKPNQTEKLRRAALACDEAYTRELVRVYGDKAGDARYKFKHDDQAVMAAMHAKLAADKAYWARLEASYG